MRAILSKCVDQMEEGNLYKGLIELAESSFEFALKFENSKPEMTMGEKDVPMMELFRDGQKINLTREENLCLMAFIVEDVIELWEMTKDTPTFKDAGVFSVTTCEFHPKAVAMLSQPKFGCVFN